MARCTYVARGTITNPSCVVPDCGRLFVQGETLPEITRQVRKLVRLVHGNLIRTALIEEGIYHLDAMGRKKTNANTSYSIDIFVMRGDQGTTGDGRVDIK